MKGKYPITGTFIDEVTYDIPASNWSNEQWAADLDNMKAVGMDTLIIMRSVFYNKCLYLFLKHHILTQCLSYPYFL